MPKILKCCILGCQENSRNVMDEVSFHRIPKDEATRKQWIDLIRSKTNQPNVFSIHALVCCKHFEKNQFAERVNGSRVLINNAFPSIFPNELLGRNVTGWSDDEEVADPLKNVKIVPSSTVVRIFKKIDASPTKDGTVNFISKNEYGNQGHRMTGNTGFNESCRFCLTVPASTEIESSSLTHDIANWYRILTGIEFHTTTYVTPKTICKACSTKLKNAFDFREQLIKMNSHWETLVKIEDTTSEQTVVVSELKEQLDPPQPPKMANDPNLQVVIVGDDNLDPESIQPITEYVYYEPMEDEPNDDNNEEDDGDHDIDNDENTNDIDDSLNDNANDDNVSRTVQSDEDDKFIQFVEDFVKRIKPVPRSQLKRIKPVKPPGKLLTARSARIIAADQEKLNFRSTACPHSSQKLKKHEKWWRLMHDCNYCDAKDFLNVEDMNKHLKLMHADLVKVTCDICKKDYSELKYLRKHMKYVHQTRQNECEICKKKFYYNYNLKSHMQIHTNEKTVICHLCGKFFTPISLHRHLKTGIHGPLNKTVKEQINKTIRYYCHLCVPAKRFNLCSELTEHRRLEHNDFECPICKGWFSCSQALQNHLKTHSNKERKHSCKLCPSTYVRASHLEGHMRRKHSTDPKPFACDLCDYRCVEPYELSGHKKHAHFNVRPYKCVLCARSFSKDQAHKDHLLTSHGIGEYRFFCSECHKPFTNSNSLIHHRGIHHKGLGNNVPVE